MVMVVMVAIMMMILVVGGRRKRFQTLVEKVFRTSPDKSGPATYL